MKNLGILFICLLCLLLNVENSYAGKLIDKPSEGYVLYLPQSALLGKPSSVLVCLPGWGISAKQDINTWGFPAEKNNFIVIDFDVNYNLIKSSSNVENLYNRIERTISHLSLTYSLDTQHTYIAGTSAGGMLSIALALMYPDEFIAVGVISGARLGFGAQNYLRNAKGIDFYLIHGQKDKTVPIGEFRSTISRLKKYGAFVKFDIIEEGAHTLPSYVYRGVVDWLSERKK